ncbi:hypothetical protein [Bacillus solitudinis]|nr:hypothetical protein [Bacillus solitudinis]
MKNKEKQKTRKRKRDMIKDFLKKNVKNWQEKSKQGPVSQSTRRTTA